MSRSIDLEVCQCQTQAAEQLQGNNESTSVKCHWPELHSVVCSLRDKGEVKGVLVIDEEAVRGGRMTRAASASASAGSTATDSDASGDGSAEHEVDPITAVTQQVSLQLQNLGENYPKG